MHTDDPFFLYWARKIAPLPGDVPVTAFNWIRYEEPMLAETGHTAPGWALVLAGARHLAGERVPFLHWLQWPFATLFLVAVFLLARAVGAPPWGSMLACAASPVFLLPAASLLGDVPGVGLALLGLAVWHGVPGWRGRIAGGLLLAAAGQMKQSVLVFFPLLLVGLDGSVARERGAWIAAGVSLLLAGTYPDVPPHDPEPSTIAGHVAWLFASTWNPGLVRMKLGYLATACGSLVLPVAVYALAVAVRAAAEPARRRGGLAVLGLLVVPVLSAAGFWKAHAGAIGYWAHDSGAGARLDAPPATWNTLWFYAVLTVFVLWLVVTLRPRDRGASAWLNAWLLAAGTGFVATTWFPAVRHMLPVLPALVMLALLELRRGGGERVARWGTALAIAGNLWLAVGLGCNDWRFARFCVQAAARGGAEAAARRLPLLTTASWGLRYAVERQGGRILERSTEPLPQGAVMLEPALTDRRVLPAALRRRSRVLWTMVCPPSRGAPWILPVQTIPPAAAMAAFHGGYVWFPFAFTRAPSEAVRALEIRPLPLGP